jgi:hypothetical protein
VCVYRLLIRNGTISVILKFYIKWQRLARFLYDRSPVLSNLSNEFVRNLVSYFQGGTKTEGF